MRVFFDTSVLVPALVDPHPHHERAICWIEAVARQSPKKTLRGTCTWHALAETWSVLTRLPIEPAISPPMAEVAINRLRQHLEATTLNPKVYQAAVRRCAQLGLRSGSLFDALHLVAAESANADCFLTFNIRDFERLATDATPRLIVPPDPPAVTI